MPTIEEYDAWKRSQSDQAIARTGIVLDAARKTNPDAFASDVKLGQAFGIDAGLASSGRDVLQGRLDSLRNTSILKGSPRTAEWLREADNARAAWDDIENLTWFERTAAEVSELGKATPGGAVSTSGVIMEGAGQLLAPRPEADRAPLVSRIASARTLSPEALAQLRKDIFAQGILNPTVAQSVLSDVLAGDMPPEEVAAAFEPMGGDLSKALQSYGEATQEYGDKLFPAAPGMENSVGRKLGKGLGSMVPAIAVGLVTGGTGAVAASVAQGAGEASSRARKAGQNEETQTKAALAGTIPGLASAIPFERLLNNPVTRTALERVLRSVGRQTLVEGGEEAAQELMQNLIAQQLYAPNQSVLQGVGESAAVGGTVGALVELAKIAFQAALPGRINTMHASARQAEETKATIDQIGDKATGSKLRQRLDGSFMDFVGKATDGTPIQDLYVPAAKLEDLSQSHGFNPKDFLDDLPGVEAADYDLALSSGGDIRIPTAVYAAKLAGTDVDAFLRENMRFSPEGMTVSEAQAFHDRSTDIQLQAFDEAEAARQAQDRERAVSDRELSELTGRLQAAGRPADVAGVEALPIATMRRTMAEIDGLTPEEFEARYPLPEIRRERPDGFGSNGADLLSSQLAELRAYAAQTEKGGPSLLEAIDAYGGIDDPGGVLKAREESVVNSGRFKTRLRLTRENSGEAAGTGKKHGFDDIARAMIEAGYLKDSPIANEYRRALETGGEAPDIGRGLLEAIDQELGGAPHKATTQAGDQKAKWADDRLAYLDSLGVSINDSDDAIRTALDQAARQEGRSFGQATLRQKLVKLRKSLADLVAFSKVTPFGENRTVEIAQVSDAVADTVEQQVGIDVHGYSHTIDTSAIRHILKNHGDAKSETKRGMVAITESDLLEIPRLISTADKIVTGAKGKRGEDLIGYLKKMDDGTTLYIEEARSGKKKLAAVSMRKYPATIDSSSIAKTISPNVRNDGGNGVTITELPAGSKTLFQSDNPGAGVETVSEQDNQTAGANFTKVDIDPNQRVPVVQSKLTVEDVGPWAQERKLALETMRGSVTAPDGRTVQISSKIKKMFVDHRGNDLKLVVLRSLPELIETAPIYHTAPDHHGRPTLSYAYAAGAINVDGTDYVVALRYRVDRGEVASAYQVEGYEVRPGGTSAGASQGTLAVQPAPDRSYSVGEIVESFKARPYFQDERRGSIQLPLVGAQIGGAQAGPVIINLFQNADLSTVLHESGHYFLFILQDMATTPGASAQIADMYSSVQTWWAENADAVAADAKKATGVEVSSGHVHAFLQQGSSGSFEIDTAVEVGLHEQFARAFEAYLMEGKAPSIALRAAFERFAQWLVKLYKSLRALNVNVSPELRSVFDRMLATEAEIEAARSDLSDHMVFTAPETAGISPQDYEHLKTLHEQAMVDAKIRLRKEVMAPILREQQPWFQEETAQVRNEVGPSINRTPVYRALEWLANGLWLGDENPQAMPDMRLDRQTLVDRYGEGVLQTLPSGRFTIYADDGGMNPDEVAGWFGFDSGDALVKALQQAQPRGETIAAETERVMLERHGDVLRDGQIEARAIDALHNDTRAHFLAAELKVLKARVGDTSADMTVAHVAEAARLAIQRMKVRDAVSSNRFLAAEKKAANEAIRHARQVERENLWSRPPRRDGPSAVRSGSLQAADSATDRANATSDPHEDAVSLLVEHKRRQLLNHMLTLESVKIAQEVEKAEQYGSELGQASTRMALADDGLDAIDELLERYDFRPPSARAENRGGALMTYVAKMTEEGRENELSIPDTVLQEAQRRPYKQLSVEELRGVVDSLKNIAHTARRKPRLKDAKRERDLETVVEDIMAAFDQTMTGPAPSRAKPGRGSAKPGFRNALNLAKTADTILREIDGVEDGAAYRHIKAPIDEAVHDLTIKRRQAAKTFEQLYAVYSQEERRAMTTLQSVPELKGQFSKWDLISIALHVGNEDNYQGLTDPQVKGHFQPRQIDAALARLDARDWTFVQSAWDMLDAYWPDIEAREKRVTGVAPKKVVPREVQTQFGTLKGGYFPLIYDAEITSLAQDDDLDKLAASMMGGRFGKAQTQNGHSKERARSSGRPVMIDLGVLHGHVNQLIHDLALSEVVANARRILQNHDVTSAFLQRDLKSDFDSLNVWLQDVASGAVRGADFINRWARKMESGLTVSKLAFNLTTALLQPTGIAQSFGVVGKKNMLLGFQDMMRHPLSGPGSASSLITSTSPFMKGREPSFNTEISDLPGDTKAGSLQNRGAPFARNDLAPWGFRLMQNVPFYTVDIPTWLAGYRQAVDQGKSEADAIVHADRIVARAAASGPVSDRTPIERGVLPTDRHNDVVRLFTALGSYMFAKFNVAYEKTGQTEFKDPRQVLSWTSDMVMLFTVEALLAAAVRGRLPWGSEGESESESEGDEGWADFLASQTALSAVGTLPYVRDIASGARGFSGGGAYGAIMDTIARPIVEAAQGAVDLASSRSMVEAGGLFLHRPSPQINDFIDATWRPSDGGAVSPMEYIMGPSA